MDKGLENHYNGYQVGNQTPYKKAQVQFSDVSSIKLIRIKDSSKEKSRKKRIKIDDDDDDNEDNNEDNNEDDNDDDNDDDNVDYNEDISSSDGEEFEEADKDYDEEEDEEEDVAKNDLESGHVDNSNSNGFGLSASSNTPGRKQRLKNLVFDECMSSVNLLTFLKSVFDFYNKIKQKTANDFVDFHFYDMSKVK
jgi:cobalamin biosynthesis protein CobT